MNDNKIPAVFSYIASRRNDMTLSIIQLLILQMKWVFLKQVLIDSVRR